MSPIRSRAVGVAVATTLAVLSLGSSAAVAAADSPTEAVSQFLDMADSGDFSGLDDVVCAADREAMREAFDFGAQLGLGDDATLAEPLSFDIKDRSVEVLSEEGDTAVLAVSATMFMTVPEDQVDIIVRALLEAELGPDDPPVTDDDVGQMAGFMASALNQTQAIDEEVTVIREDGGWLVCGGLIDEPEDPYPGFEPTVSTEGLCGITSPQELNGLSDLQYDSASGFAEFCSYYTSDFDDYHTTSVSFGRDQGVADLAAVYGADQELEVAGATAFATGADGFAQQLLTQVGEDVLQVSVSIDYEADTDWLTQATLITELLAPRLPEYRELLFGPASEPTPEPTPEVSLCEALPIDDLNSAFGLGFDDAAGDSFYCGYSSLEGEPGYHNVSVSIAEVTLDDYLTWLPDMTEGSVGGQRALLSDAQIFVELPGGAFTLSSSGWVDPADEAATVTSQELALLVAEMLLPNMIVPEPTGLDFEPDPLEGALGGDPDGSAGPGLQRPLCEYVDLDAINALGIFEYDDVSGLYDEVCSVTQTDFEKGYTTLTMLGDPGSLAELRDWFSEVTDVTVAGLPGFIGGPDLYVETSAGTIAFYPVLSDAATAAGMETSEITIPVAELVVTAIEADTD